MNKQEKKQWLENRRNSIGGSDVDSVLSLPPYGCPRKLFYDKRGIKEDYPILNNKHIERGVLLEPLARKIFQDKKGYKVEEVEQITSKSRPFMGCNIDGLILPDPLAKKAGKGVLEIKCPARENYIKFKREGLPESYILQMQHNLSVCNLKWGFFFIFNADLWEWLSFSVKRDEELCKSLIEKEEAFWKLVENGPIPAQLEIGDKRCKKCTYRITCLGELAEGIEDYDLDDEIENFDGNEEYCEAVEDYINASEIFKESETLKEDAGYRIKSIVKKGQISKGGKAKKVIYRLTLRTSWDVDMLNSQFQAGSVFAKKYKKPISGEYFRVFAYEDYVKD